MAKQLNSKQLTTYLRTGGYQSAEEEEATTTTTTPATGARDFNAIYAEMRADRNGKTAQSQAQGSKAGRAISSVNRDTINNALAGMSKAMKALQTHHGAIADLMRKTDPDHTRQDEYDVEGDDDTENGGHNINDGWPKSRYSPQRKQGRAISSANRATIQNALDGMADAMKALQAHHGTMADLVRKTDPDHTRQDEYDVEGDDDSENGGHNINDGWPKSRSALLAEIDDLTDRLKYVKQVKQVELSMGYLSRKMALSSVRHHTKQMLMLAHAHPEEMRPGQRLRNLLSNTPNVAHIQATHKSQALAAVATLKQLAPELVGTGAESDMVPIAGYLSTWDLDLGGDICDPGCYTQTIANLKAEQARTHSRFLIPMLWQHNMEQPIGGWTSLEQDGYGLFAMGLVDPDTELGAQALSALRKGYTCGLSIGYTVVRSLYGSDGARHLQQIDLVEGSVVTLAMNPMASVTTLN